jgi:hypothetical protein
MNVPLKMSLAQRAEVREHLRAIDKALGSIVAIDDARMNSMFMDSGTAYSELKRAWAICRRALDRAVDQTRHD